MLNDKNRAAVEKEIDSLEIELACNDFLGLLEKSAIQKRIEELERLLGK